MTHAKDIQNHSPSTVAIDAAATDPQDEPFPPRYWWLKRILAGVGLLLVGLVLLRLVWGWETNRRLQAEIDSYIAAGEPVYPEDFDPPEDIPDDQNAAKFLIDAAAAVTLTPQQVELISKALDDVEVVRIDADALLALVEANAQALSLVRKARDVSGVDWGYRLRRPTITIMVPWLGPQRNLAKLTCAAAVSHGLRRNHAYALDALHDALAQSHAISEAPSLIHYLVGVACRSLAIATLEELAPTLGANDESTEVSERSQRSMRALMRSLLDEGRFRTSFVQALLANRCCDLDTVQCILDGSTGLPWLGVPVSALWTTRLSAQLGAPLLVSDATALMKHSTIGVRASREPNWPRAAALLPPDQASDRVPDIRFHPLSLLRWDSTRSVRVHFRTLARSRMAAVSLAIRLYEFDHDRRPTSVNELVPAYLPSIPLDPFAEGDRPLGYVADGGAPRLYSIGSDGVDDGGMTAVHASGRFNVDRLDLVFPLAGKRPTAPSPP